MSGQSLPPGYSIEPSGSGCNYILRKDGQYVTYAPRYGHGWEILVNIAHAMEAEEKEMA
jgi:hypothetical protein